MPAIAVARICSRSGNSENTAVKTDGMMAPPQNPWMIRKRMSAAKPPLAAQPALARVKPAIAARKSRRSESSCVSQPVSGMAMISAMR
jgi:hypothetical protein